MHRHAHSWLSTCDFSQTPQFNQFLSGTSEATCVKARVFPSTDTLYTHSNTPAHTHTFRQ